MRCLGRWLGLGRCLGFGLGLGLGLAAMVATPALASSSSGQPSRGSRSCQVPAHVPKGRIVVPLVVDFGGANGTILVTCVVTAPGVSGEQVLEDQAARLRYAQPSFCPSGLIWTIDGYPGSTCPANPASDNAYWAYWHGGKTWSYSSVGAAGWTISKDDVEGWRYEPDGKASAPRAPSSPSVLEAAPASPTATSPTTTAATAPTATTTPPKTTNPSGDAAGPKRASGGGGSDSGRLWSLVGVVLVVVFGSAAFVRTRRARLRSM